MRAEDPCALEFTEEFAFGISLRCGGLKHAAGLISTAKQLRKELRSAKRAALAKVFDSFPANVSASTILHELKPLLAHPMPRKEDFNRCLLSLMRVAIRVLTLLLPESVGFAFSCRWKLAKGWTPLSRESVGSRHCSTFELTRWMLRSRRFRH